jgi:hypothetical protein
MTDDDKSEEPGAEKSPAAKEELFEAIDHFKRAANILFDRAAKDPAVKSATVEAERVIKKLGDTAEPLARQLTDEIGRLTKRISETVQEQIDARKRPSETPPPDDDAEA